MNSMHNDKPWFVACLNNQELSKKLQGLKMVVCDIDGTLTNGTMAYNQDGELFRYFSITDGFGIVSAQHAGLIIAILSGKAHDSAQQRAKKLHIPEHLCFGGREKKLEVIKQMAQQESLELNQILLFGDDYYDAKVKMAAPQLLYATSHDAPFYFHQHADIIVPRNGGNHAARLLLDLILYLKKKHFAQASIAQAINE